MKLSRFLPVLVLVLPAVCLFGQEAPRNLPSNTVYVGADGKFEASPDTAVINFNIGAQEPVLKDAYARAQKAAEQIRQTLTANGIDPKEAQISSFQVAPVYDWKNPKRKLIAYQVSSSITVKVKDFAKVGPIAESFANMDVTENQSISYALENMESAKAKAVEDAFKKARANAEVLVKAAGRQLGQLVYSSVDVNEMEPMP
ncbi:MAG TPA: SIMPL domain-containing protein, partial [Terriglobales bacterium]|nr:SIMPL domain-containing protein [Terriglobales bacterium]